MPDHDWDSHYQGGQVPWETGYPSGELRRVIAEDGIAPSPVFELGCGTGINAVWLAQQGFDVTAVDISRVAVEKARRRAAEAGVSVRFEVADVLDLPAGYGPFPLFFDRGCYHAVRRTDAGAYVRSLQRVTAPGALGLILAGNANSTHKPGEGPPVVTAEQMHAELEPAFEIVRLREFVFDQAGEGDQLYLGWSCLLRRGR
jgi:SAM-dependent methyltransferase